MSNGGMNVEIGNPSYNMYEVDHDSHSDAGSILHPNFTLDPHKVCKNAVSVVKSEYDCCRTKYYYSTKTQNSACNENRDRI